MNENRLIPAGKTADGTQTYEQVQVQRPGSYKGSVVPTTKPLIAADPNLQAASGVQRMEGWSSKINLEDALVFVMDNLAGLADAPFLLFDGLGYAKLYTYAAASYAVFQASAPKTTLFRQAISLYPIQLKGFKCQAQQNSDNLERDFTILSYGLKGTPNTDTRNLAQGTDGTIYNDNIVKYQFDSPQPIYPYDAIYVECPAGEKFTWTFYPYGKLNILTR